MKLKKIPFLIFIMIFSAAFVGGCGNNNDRQPAVTEENESQDVESTSENVPEGAAVNYYEIYESGDVPQIYISTVDGVGAELEKDTGYVDAVLAFVDTDGTVIQDTSGRVKVRGNSTAEGKKKPYDIKFSESREVPGLGKGKTWCLLANCFDPTLVRNYLVTDMASQMGLEYTSDQAVVEVYMDGTFLGCYNMIEKIESSADRVDIDIDNGDFLVEYEAEKDEEGVTYITTENGIRFDLREPAEPTDEQLAAITDILNQLDSAIMSDDYESVLDIIDQESFAKYYLLSEYVKPVDIYYSSVFFYYKDGRLYAGPVWDYDQSMGNAWDEQYPDYYNSQDGTNSYEGLRANWNLVYYHLLTFDDFVNAVEEQYESYHGIFEDLGSEGGYVDRFVSEYRSVIDRNFNEAGWLVDGQYSFLMRIPDETYEENVDFLKDWLNNRLIWMDEYLEYEE